MVDEVKEAEVTEVTQEANQVKTLTFVLTHDEANIVLSGLGELPSKVSMGVIQKLQQQAQPQL